MKRLVHRLLFSDDGQDLVEYALLSTFIALACLLGVNALQTALSGVFTVIANQLQND
jgi:Flp pilus assembly pilin Flp